LLAGGRYIATLDYDTFLLRFCNGTELTKETWETLQPMVQKKMWMALKKLEEAENQLKLDVNQGSLAWETSRYTQVSRHIMVSILGTNISIFITTTLSYSCK
jgi:hypothetical protein